MKERLARRTRSKDLWKTIDGLISDFKISSLIFPPPFDFFFVFHQELFGMKRVSLKEIFLPPLVGIADTISAMPRATSIAWWDRQTDQWTKTLVPHSRSMTRHSLINETMIHPQTMTAGPPTLRPVPNKLGSIHQSFQSPQSPKKKIKIQKKKKLVSLFLHQPFFCFFSFDQSKK